MTLAHIRHLVIALALCVLAGCASTPQQGHIARLSPEELAKLTPPAKPNIPLSEVVMWSQEGAKPDAIIKRLTDTGTFYNLTPQQIVDLNKQSVDQRVIDHLVQAQEKARQATLITQLADRDAKAARDLERERNRARALQRQYDSWSYGYSGWGPRYGFGWSSGPYYDPFFRSWRRW